MKTNVTATTTVHTLRFAAIACAISLTSPSSHATQALQFFGGLIETIPGPELGWSFHVSTPITIDSFGWFDAGSNGFVETHSVHVWAGIGLTGTLIATGLVQSTDPLTSGYRFAPITPLTLAIGDYIISGNSGSDGFQDFGASVTTMPEITYLGGRYEGLEGEFPARAADRGISYVGPNFTATAALVPEPSSLALVLGGTAISALLHRRRRNS